MSSNAAKRRALKQARAFNLHSEQVRAVLFRTHPFFDSEDKAQVKYEMLRHREFEKAPLVEACHDFGFTRETYRHLLERFGSEGMSALFEKKRGRQQPLKVGETVRKWLWDEHQRNAELGADVLADRLDEQTGVRLSRRTVYRVLADTKERKKKRRRRKPRG